MDMASVGDILHFFAQEACEDSKLPTSAQVAPPPPTPRPPAPPPKRESEQPMRGSIPTSVIQSCIRSTSTGETSMSSSSSSYDASSEDSEGEQASRKRPMATITEESGLAPKVTKFDFDDSVVRVTPLRPVCKVFMVSYGQEDSIDQHAGRTPNIIDEPFAGLPIDLRKIVVPSLGTISARLEYRRKRRECDPFIYTERFKTVWYSDTEGPNGEPVRMTVPFTVDVSDIFNSFTHNTVPQSIRDKTFQYAMERASQLAKFRHLFAMNDPNAGCLSSPFVDLTKHEPESRIVWGGRHPEVSDSHSA